MSAITSQQLQKLHAEMGELQKSYTEAGIAAAAAKLRRDTAHRLWADKAQEYWAARHGIIKGRTIIEGLHGTRFVVVTMGEDGPVEVRLIRKDGQPSRKVQGYYHPNRWTIVGELEGGTP